jgi:hypothetical protein
MITKRIKIAKKAIGIYKTGEEFLYNGNIEKIIGFIVSEDTKKVSLVITNQEASHHNRLLGYVGGKNSRFDFEDETLYYTTEYNKWKIIETDIVLNEVKTEVKTKVKITTKVFFFLWCVGILLG